MLKKMNTSCDHQCLSAIHSGNLTQRMNNITMFNSINGPVSIAMLNYYRVPLLGGWQVGETNYPQSADEGISQTIQDLNDVLGIKMQVCLKMGFFHVFPTTQPFCTIGPLYTIVTKHGFQGLEMSGDWGANWDAPSGQQRVFSVNIAPYSPNDPMDDHHSDENARVQLQTLSRGRTQWTGTPTNPVDLYLMATLVSSEVFNQPQTQDFTPSANLESQNDIELKIRETRMEAWGQPPYSIDNGPLSTNCR